MKTAIRLLPRTLPRTSTPQFLQQRRGLATVQDAAPPKRTTFGGLRDQDRIFSNAYRLGDHGIKGAMVSSLSLQFASREVATISEEKGVSYSTIEYTGDHGNTLRSIVELARIDGNTHRSSTRLGRGESESGRI